MSRSRHPLACKTLLLMAVTLAGASVLEPASAQAAEPPSDEQANLRLAPPTLSLQPEGARLFVNVPSELLPPPLELRRFMFDRTLLVLPRPSIPSVACNNAGVCVRYTLGIPRVRLEIEDRSRSVGFGVTVLPRAAVAVLRFDPLPPHVR